MQNWKRIFVGVATAALVGCEGPISPTYTNSSGSLALSRDDALLYALDTDNEILAVVDTRKDEVIAKVKVGKVPTRVVVGHDDTIYVSNRGSRSVSVIRRGDFSAPAATIADVGVEPTGMAVSADDKLLYVVSSTSLDDASVGTLTAIDVASLQPVWEMKVGEEPRAIALLRDNTAIVSLYRRGEFVKVNLETQTIVKDENDIQLYQNVNRSRLEGTNPGFGRTAFSSFHARAAADVVVSPDGERVYAPVVWAREDAIATAPSTFGGYYANGGPCNIGAIATAGLVTLTAQAEPKVDDLTACAFSTNSDGKDFPPSTVAVDRSGNRPVQGPVAAAVDPTGAWLFLVNKETNSVAVMPTARRDGDDLSVDGVSFSSTGSSVRDYVSDVGAGPDGIALTRDGKKAYVYSQFDHRIDTLVSTGSGPEAEVINTGKVIAVAQDTLSADLVSGRKMFFDARDQRMSAKGTNVACSTCHLEGRDDSHVWNFPDGPRQTPTLAGRATLKTGPYHWNGEFVTLASFMDHTIKARMGGIGVTDTVAGHIAAFVDSLPAADNPHQQLDGTLTEPQVRGKAVFEKAQCNGCHAGETLTNNLFANVGTLVTKGANPDDLSKLPNGGLNTPSLLNLARTAPYLHDGSATSLRHRLQLSKATDQHGLTSPLSDAEMDDLVEYLKSL
ncbi:MAG: c-type cytochrome [Myxococcota bacterium]